MQTLSGDCQFLSCGSPCRRFQQRLLRPNHRSVARIWGATY